MAAYYRPESFCARDCVGYLVARVHGLMRPQIEAVFDKQDLSFSQWRVLMCLRDGLASTCADIARELSHDSGSLTRLVDQLDQRGLIRRTRDRKDRRVVTLALTASGRAAVSAVLPDVVAHCNDLLKDFSHGEVKTLIALLTRLLVRTAEIEKGVSEAAASSRERAA
ncbi:MAG: MarR family winged helix-turn-helix transcriptional regulator [Rhizomicrobium sp.]|jgi:DNA-binding MarR family transcriptional regulator